MKYFTNPKNNGLYAYADDGSQDKLIPSDYVPVNSVTVATMIAASKAALLAKIAANPLSISPLQFRTILTRQSRRDAFEAAVAKSSVEFKDAYAYAKSFTETDALIVTICEDIGMAVPQIHAMFVAAGQLPA